jgi:hypothetical protein
MAIFTLSHGSRRESEPAPRPANALLLAIDTALDVFTTAQRESADFVQDTLFGIARTAARTGYDDQVADALARALRWTCACERTVPTAGLVDALLDLRIAAARELELVPA